MKHTCLLKSCAKVHFLCPCCHLPLALSCLKPSAPLLSSVSAEDSNPQLLLSYHQLLYPPLCSGITNQALPSPLTPFHLSFSPNVSSSHLFVPLSPPSNPVRHHEPCAPFSVELLSLQSNIYAKQVATCPQSCLPPLSP